MNKQLNFQSPPTTLVSYGIALLLPVVALFAVLVVNTFIGDYVRIIFLAFVVLNTLWGGLGSGLVGSFLAAILADYFFLVPTGSFFSDVNGFFFLFILVVMSLLISWIKQTRQRSEQSRFDTKAQLETILKGFTDGILAQDLDGEPIFANEAAAHLTGFPSADVMASTPIAELQKRFELFDEEGNVLPPNRLPRKLALEQGKNSELTVRLHHRETHEDRWFTFRSAIVWDSNKQPRLTLTILQDITAQKQQASDRLKMLFAEELQRRRMQTILDNVPGIVWETKIKPENGQHEVIFVSNYTEQMLGYSVDELLKMPDFWDKVLQKNDDLEDALEETTTILDDDKLGKAELRIEAKDGRTLPVESHITPLFDDAQRPIGACGVLIDVTERKKAEMNLAHYAIELQRSNKELQQFAYIASHDLQEPLRMVGSYLQLIESRYADKLDKDGHEFIAFAVDGATRMKELIQGLLMYSRVETEAKNFVPLNFQEVVKEVQQLLAVSIEETGAVITVGELPEIRADERLIIQLFQNLIGNAIKYRSDRKPEIHIGATRKEDKWLFSIRDNGIGIEEQYLERIFVIFQRLHTQKQHSGTGIGLSICKKVVERHGGYIWAESEIGTGTTFYFTMPV